MKTTANSVISEVPKQVPYNSFCATCTYNCKQAAYAQVIFCHKFSRDRYAMPTKQSSRKGE